MSISGPQTIFSSCLMVAPPNKYVPDNTVHSTAETFNTDNNRVFSPLNPCIGWVFNWSSWIQILSCTTPQIVRISFFAWSEFYLHVWENFSFRLSNWTSLSLFSSVTLIYFSLSLCLACASSIGIYKGHWAPANPTCTRRRG